MSKKTKGISRPEYIIEFIKNTQEHALTLDESKRPGYITTMCARVVRSFLRDMGWYTNSRTGELEGTPRCSSKTLASIFSEYRQIIIKNNIKHHLFDKHASRIIRDFQDVEPRLPKMLSVDLTSEKLEENLIVLRQGIDRQSEYGKALIELKIHFALYYNLNVPQIVSDTNRQMQSDRLEKTHNNKVSINPDWVRQVINDKFNEKHPTVGGLCVAIGLATGRRLTEILRTANFKKVDDVTLLFSGQLKTKNRKLFEEIKPYKINTLVPADEVIKAFKKLRLKLKAETVNFVDRLGNKIESSVVGGETINPPLNKAVTSKYGNSMNAHAKRILGADMTFKTTRAIWAELSYHQAASKSQTKAAYRAEALGHTGGDLSTQEHYDGFELDKTIATIFVHLDQTDINEGENTLTAFDTALLAHLNRVERKYWNPRAKAWPVIHDWLIEQLEGGASLQHIEDALKADIEKGKTNTIGVKFASYIRGNLFIDGKKLGAPTANGWVDGCAINEWYETYLESL
jgi:hypothetical protein